MEAQRLVDLCVEATSAEQTGKWALGDGLLDVLDRLLAACGLERLVSIERIRVDPAEHDRNPDDHDTQGRYCEYRLADRVEPDRRAHADECDHRRPRAGQQRHASRGSDHADPDWPHDLRVVAEG